MRITRIESQKKNSRRRNVFTDGEFRIGVSVETLLRSGLRTGDEVSEDRIKDLARQDEIFSAKTVALRFLTHRPRTVTEVRDRLREEEFGDGDIEQVIESLKQAGLLNDVEFARMYINDALAAKATGKTLLKRKLLLLGVEKGIIDEALQKAFATVDEQAEAMKAGRQFLAKSAATHKPAHRMRLRQRLSSFLGRRGFTWETVEAVVRALIPEKEE